MIKTHANYRQIQFLKYWLNWILLLQKRLAELTFAFLSPGRSKIIYLSIKKKEIGKEREWDKGKKKKEGRRRIKISERWKLESRKEKESLGDAKTMA